MDLEINILINEKVEKYVEQYGSSKAFIAKKAGMSKQTLYSLLNTKNPTIESLIRIAIALDCNVEELYSYTIHPDIE